MNVLDQQAGDQKIDQLLAQTDGDGSPKNNAADSTVDKLRNELETIATHLKEPVMPEPFEAEPACVRAVELAVGVAQKSAPVSAKVKVSKVVDADPSELGEVGPYKLLKLLGQGGMGAVYKALHPRLDKIVALKVLRAGRIKGELVDRFQREMKALGKLDHPHLIRALDAGEADGTHYLVMEFVAGMDLSALLAKRGKLPIADACELVAQAAMGLHAAHTRGMVHRDIKPANLMLAEQEFGPPIVKVLDLGLALLAESPRADEGGLTSDGQIMGTIDYMPPEQAQDSHTVDARADIYSLGATLYTLLTGGSIFHGRPHTTLMQKLLALATEPIPPIRERRPDVSESLAAIVHRMIARDPKDRFASPAEVVAALKPFAVGADLSALIAGDSDHTILEATDVVELAKVREKLSHEASTKALEVVQPTVVIPAASRRKRLPVAIATAVAGVVLLGAILFSLKTPNGEVVVEIPDDLPAEVKKDIKINVTGDGAAEVASEANGWKIGIKEGKYSVELTGGSDRVQVEDKQVTVSRSKKAIVTITMKPTGAMAAKGTKPAGGANSDPDRRAAEWILTINDGGAPDLYVTIGGQITRVENRQLPSEPFQVFSFPLGGPIIDKWGDRLADELATKITGIRLKEFRLASRTLTTAGFAKLLAMPEFSELSTLEFLCHDNDMDDGVFPLLAKLPDLNRLTIVASSGTGSPNLTGKGIGELKACSRLGTINWLFNTPSPKAVEELAQLSKLDSLGFTQITCTEKHTLALSKLKLRQLVFLESKVDDSMVRHLATMEKLQTLGLRVNPITDKGLSELKALENLKTIDLCVTKVTAAGIAELQKALPDCKIEWDYPDPDRKLAEWLRSYDPQLTFGGNFTDNVHFAVEPGQPIPNKPFRLNFINLVGKKCEEQGDAYLDELAKHLQGVRLKGLLIHEAPFTAAGMIKFLSLPEMADLTNLESYSKAINDDVLAVISQRTKLTGLVFQAGPKLTGKGIGQLRGLTELTGLTMLGCPGFSAEAMEQLQTMPKLEALHIDGFRFTEQHLAAITKFKLKQLLTNEAGIDDAMAARFAEMQTLEALGFTKSPITDAGLPELKKLIGLTVLHLFGTNVTAAGVADLQQALPKCKIEWDAPKK